jgi:dipeptidyl aminopeptidase/acylaminoacyl peptidase
MLALAYGGDGYYVHTPSRDRQRILPVKRGLHARLREMTDESVEVVKVAHARGLTTGLLHLPPGPTNGSVPALVGLHQLSGDKDDFDATLAPFRQAGYATLCIDLPAHGENFDGPRLAPDDEQVAAAALDALAARPEIDAGRLGVVGGSLGAFFALRTAAASPRVRACLAYASPFDIGLGIKDSVYGIRDNFAWAVGARSYRETLEKARPFHLRTGLERIACPVLVVHGTQDHICDFTASYEIARRVRAPLTVVPLPGVDHEAAVPSAPMFSGPGIEWLRGNL